MPALYRTALASAVFTLMTTACAAQETDCSTRTLPISVRDAQGIPIRGLQPGDFEAKIHGKPAQILSITPDTRPHRLVILLDTSGSMAGGIGMQVGQLAAALAKHAAVSGATGGQLALVLFGDKVTKTVGFAEGNTAVIHALEQIIDSSPGSIYKGFRGDTAVYDAILYAYGLLEHPTSADLLYVVTDGVDNKSHAHAKDVQNLLARNDVRLFSVVLMEALGYRERSLEELHSPPDFEHIARQSGGAIFGPIEVHFGDRLLVSGNLKEGSSIKKSLTRFYDTMLGNDLITLQIPAGIRKRQRLQVKLSEESRKKWKDAQVFVPGEIEPCTTAKSE